VPADRAGPLVNGSRQREGGGSVWLGPNWAVRRRAVRAEQAIGRGRGGAGLGWSGGFVSRVSAQGRLGVLVSICI